MSGGVRSEIAVSSLGKQGTSVQAQQGDLSVMGRVGAGTGRLLQISEMMKRSRNVGATGLRLRGRLTGLHGKTERKRKENDRQKQREHRGRPEG